MQASSLSIELFYDSPANSVSNKHCSPGLGLCGYIVLCPIISLVLVVQNDTFENIWQYEETSIKTLSEKEQAMPVDLGTDKESSLSDLLSE